MRTGSLLLASKPSGVDVFGSVSSQSTGQNHLVRAFGSGQTAITLCTWLKVNSWGKLGNSNPQALSLDNGVYSSAYRQSGSLGEAYAAPTTMDFGTYDASVGSGFGTTYGVISALGVWTFASVVLSGTTVTFHSGQQTGGLTTTSFAAPTDVTNVVQASLCAQMFTGFQAWSDISIRAAKLWLGRALTAAELLAERASFAPVSTSSLDSYLPLISAGTPGAAAIGTSWTVGGSFAADLSAPDLSGL